MAGLVKMDGQRLFERLESGFSDTDGIYVNAGVDENVYFNRLIKVIRDCLKEPFELSAVVTPPGIPGFELGSTISGVCVAHDTHGTWLVYRPETDLFYCFWGTEIGYLQAPGIYGSPLYCWAL